MATFETPAIALPLAVLPAAGAFSTSAPIACNTFTQITFHFSYTRGAAGGAVTYKVEFTNSVTKNKWKQIAEFTPPAVVAGADSNVPTQRAQFTYTSTSANEEGFMSPSLNVSANFVRISVAESGAVGTPGQVEVEYYLRGDQS